MQYCNRGTIYDAIDRGWLRQQLSLDSPPNLRAVLLTARVRRAWLAVGGLCGCTAHLCNLQCNAGLCACFLSRLCLWLYSLVAQDIASALAYLHANDVLHGDLTGRQGRQLQRPLCMLPVQPVLLAAPACTLVPAPMNAHAAQHTPLAITNPVLAHALSSHLVCSNVLLTEAPKADGDERCFTVKASGEGRVACD